MSPEQQLRRLFGNLYQEPATPGWFKLCYMDLNKNAKGKRPVRTGFVNLAEVGLDELVAEILDDADLPHDTYFCLCTSKEEGEDEWARGTIEECLAVRMLWLDIDIDHPAHKPKELPYPDLGQVCEVLQMFPEPTNIVHSGYGVHAYWDLDRPYLVDAPTRARFKAFQGQFIAEFKKRGLWCDDTSDATRMLRVPGTLNWKDRENPVRVELLG